MPGTDWDTWRDPDEAEDAAVGPLETLRTAGGPSPSGEVFPRYPYLEALVLCESRQELQVAADQVAAERGYELEEVEE